MSVCLNLCTISGIGKRFSLPELGFELQESGILLGGCLTVKNYWELLTRDDGVGFMTLSNYEIVWCQFHLFEYLIVSV